MKTKYITKQLIDQLELDDLDLILRDDFGVADDEYISFIETKDPTAYYLDGTELDIDILMRSLEGFKKSGATHVIMDVNIDHHAYEVCAFKIYHSTPAEVKKQEEKIEKKFTKLKDKKILTLEKELKKLKG